MFYSQDIQVFVFLNIPWFTISVTSWRVLVNQVGCSFEYILWTTTHKVAKLGPGKRKGRNEKEKEKKEKDEKMLIFTHLHPW